MSLGERIAELRRKMAAGALGQGRSGRNVATIIFGTASAQAITLGAIPILARLFSPDDFGLLATYSAITETLAIGATLSYQSAIVLPRRSSTAFLLLVFCLGVASVFSLLVGAAFYVLASPISEWLGSPRLKDVMWLIPLSVISLSGYMAASSWATRRRDFKSISITTVANRLLTSGAQLGFGISGASSSGLVVGQVLGSLAGFAFLLKIGLRSVWKSYWQQIRWSRIRVLAYQYRRFAIYGLPANLAAAFARFLPILLLGYYFSPATVGLFAMANRLVGGPTQLVASSITGVFYERASRARFSGDLGRVTLAAYERLLIMTMTPLALICVAAPDLVALVLGAEWSETAVYLQWVTLWAFFSATASPLYQIFAITDRQKEMAIINGLLLIATAIALIAGGSLGDAQTTVAIFCITSSVVWAIQGLRIVHISGANLRSALRMLLVEILRMLPFALLLLLARYTIESTGVRLALFVVLLAVFAAVRARHVLSTGRVH